MDRPEDERGDAVGPMLDDEARALVARLRASGSVFAEEEYAALRAHAEAAADGDEDAAADRLEGFVDRREHGERIEHIVEHARFAELRIHVDFGVFVPRARTVLLASIAAERLREVRDARGEGGRRPRLLDFGCGAGPIAALATHRVPGIEVVAVDNDRYALASAARNLPQARLVLADSIPALVDADARRADGGAPADPTGISASAPFDVVAANLPYVPTSQLPLLPHGTLESEPRAALDGGRDGLDPLGEHALPLAAILADDGILVTELAPHQVDGAIEILEGAGLARVEVHRDDELGATVLVAAR
ncbi:N5-glutamine methyltransferase family protein [Agrococcus carbonis]|uniref:Release factor glutamine methyltransferase n=1 Tax=Agrococcus carbonis TaxID=684552 RepID=A0A1H1SFN1_9MICO|nr:methyltransferase [Agrococcus carbonis]SDS46731.1 release factor glutamine methyltransferase [Agrococcus carbonis]